MFLYVWVGEIEQVNINKMLWDPLVEGIKFYACRFLILFNLILFFI